MALHNQLLKLTSLLQELESAIDEYKTLKELSNDHMTVNVDSDTIHILTQFVSLFINISTQLQYSLKSPIPEGDGSRQLATDPPLRDYSELKKIAASARELIESLPEISEKTSSLDTLNLDKLSKYRATRLEDIKVITHDKALSDTVTSLSYSPPSQDSLSSSLLQKGSKEKPLHKKSVRFKDHLIDGVSDKPLNTNLKPYRDHVETSRNNGLNRKEDGGDLRYHDEPVSDDASDINMSDRDVFIANQQQVLEQNHSLDHLSDSVQRQHEMSLQINDEVNDHMVLLDDLEGGINRTNARLVRGARNIKKFRDALRERGDWCTILILIVILLFLLIVLK